MLEVQQIDAPSRGKRIREEFALVGGRMRLEDFGRHCMSIGIWSDDELALFSLRNALSEIKKELRSPDKQGMPFAGRLANQLDEWAQRSFWDNDTYLLAIGQRRRQAESLHAEADALEAERRERYGLSAVA